MVGTLWSEFLRRLLLSASLAGAAGVTADQAEAALPGKDPAVLPAPAPGAPATEPATETEQH